THRLETIDFSGIVEALPARHHVTVGHRWPSRALRALMLWWRTAARVSAAAVRDRVRARRRERAFAAGVARGDVLVCLGAAWNDPGYGACIAAAKRRYGMRFAVLIHDIIPLAQPDVVDSKNIARFGRWFQHMIGVSDLVLTSSDHGRREIEGFAQRQGWRLPDVEVIRFGAGFRPRIGCGETSAALPSEFVLLVSTIDV